MKLILLGAPGAGKGTQAEVICTRLNIPAVSTGNLLREAVKNATEQGKAAKVFMDSGKLVPDELVIKMLKLRLDQDDCKNGFILDGFPRTVPQAQALESMGVVIDKVIDIEVLDDAIIKRLSGRRVCEGCGASYHIDYKKSSVEGKCDKCDGNVVLREDDKPETVLARLAIYHNQTEPLKQYYKNQNKLFEVLGQEEVKDTTALTIKALEA